MATSANKIKYGLTNVYMAPCTEALGEDGEYTYTYGTPVHVPGAVSLSMDPQGDTTKFYADNIEYFVSNANNGYEGDLEVAQFPDAVKVAFLNEAKDSKGVYYELANGADAPKFAMMFQFEGDVKAIRHVLYNCTMSRPKAEGDTKEESVSVKTESATITAIPRKDNGLVKSRTSADTDETTYSSWFTTVYVPTIE